MNYKVYKKIINDVILSNQRNKTIENKIKVLKDLDKGNKELKRMRSFLTNELVCKMVSVLELRTVEDYLILTNNCDRLNIPLYIINELVCLDRNVVKELCFSQEDNDILSKEKLDDKLKIVASIIFNFNYLIEILSNNNNNIEETIQKLLDIKDLSEIPYDDSFISMYGKDVLKKMTKNNTFTNDELIKLFNEYPNIFEYFDEDFELFAHKIIDDQKDGNDLNKIIGSLVPKL